MSGDPFAKEGRGIREVLQAVEDALIDAGHDDFVVATEHGSFHWRTVEHAHADAARENDPSRIAGQLVPRRRPGQIARMNAG